MSLHIKVLTATMLCLAAMSSFLAEPALTIYNQNFAVVRETVPLDLKQGENAITFNDITAHVEPDSVILRDPAGKRLLRVLEQNYRADPVSQELLLNYYEGKTIDFLVTRADKQEIVQGKIVRSGYQAHGSEAYQRYGRQYEMAQSARASGPTGQPLVEVDGKLRFGLPGQPLFPQLPDDSVLKPTLTWRLETDQPGSMKAEMSYITNGMSWEADYNMVSPVEGDTLSMVGWVTFDNQSGKTFNDAHIKLMAGDVSKVKRDRGWEGVDEFHASVGGSLSLRGGPTVTEKTFDEYHLYSLERPTTLRDRETKQVEFLRSPNIQSKRVYVYDGAQIDKNRRQQDILQDAQYGTQCNPKVWVMREFTNNKANGLGVPLPKGRLRFYRQDADGQPEMTGENVIDHVPADEPVKVYTGNAFDMVGERRRTKFDVMHDRRWIDEIFEIKVRNHKTEAVDARVVEHLYRGNSWKITEKSDEFKQTDSQTIEFTVNVLAKGEKTINYSVHYTW